MIFNYYKKITSRFPIAGAMALVFPTFITVCIFFFTEPQASFNLQRKLLSVLCASVIGVFLSVSYLLIIDRVRTKTTKLKKAINLAFLNPLTIFFVLSISSILGNTAAELFGKH